PYRAGILKLQIHHQCRLVKEIAYGELTSEIPHQVRNDKEWFKPHYSHSCESRNLKLNNLKP
ncbi:MAG TPA: hypothetical protein PLH91_06550, partial [Tenuifilaceae bacterium]|nr:hypothetical protein [Tenuifilaceae bacterium]